MWKDEVLEEIYRIREEHAKSFDDDLQAICDDLQKKQATSGRQIISAPLKSRSQPHKKIAETDCLWGNLSDTKVTSRGSVQLLSFFRLLVGTMNGQVSQNSAKGWTWLSDRITKIDKPATWSLGSNIDITITAINLPIEKIAEFCDRWQVIEFALFGSVLRNDFCAESDIDVMGQFHPEAYPTFSSLDQMEAELKTIFHRDIDLITRQGIETSRNYLRRQEILSSAQVIYRWACS